MTHHNPERPGPPPSADEGVVLYEKRDRIAYVTINRPEARNAVSPEVHRAMIAARVAGRPSLTGAIGALLPDMGSNPPKAVANRFRKARARDPGGDRGRAALPGGTSGG
jgi:hypothetical protein